MLCNEKEIPRTLIVVTGAAREIMKPFMMPFIVVKGRYPILLADKGAHISNNLQRKLLETDSQF